jgi:hypothetical protein
MANERIQQALAEIGKLRRVQGERDATNRYGVNLPLDMPTNFSAGYEGKAMRDLRDEYEGESNAN